MYNWIDLAGYMVTPIKDLHGFKIEKKSDLTDTRHPLHLYINIPINKLPKSDNHIRAIYYLSNFSVPATIQGNEPLNLILRDMLGTRKGYLFDPKSNSIILTGSANKIASVMTIILELDSTGSAEVIETFTLFNSTATTVAKLLNDQIIAVTKGNKGGGRLKQGKTSFYFRPNTRIIADPRTNSLTVLGTESAVNRIKTFVIEVMDQLLESGKSILHIYDLQYLESEKIAKVLQKMVGQSSTGQSRKKFGGPQRFFEDVVIIAEKEQKVEAKTLGKGSQAKGRVTVGGNRLIVAAKTEDWERIKQLIEQLDKPQLQVIIEIMILDITVDGRKASSSTNS